MSLSHQPTTDSHDRRALAEVCTTPVILVSSFLLLPTLFVSFNMYILVVAKLYFLNNTYSFFGRPFLKRIAVCYRTAVLSVLSVTLVHCGQSVGWIKMKLDTLVGLGAGHIVLDGDPPPSPPKRHSPLSGFRPISAVTKWLDGSRWHLAWRWALVQATLCQMGTHLPSQKRGRFPNFRPMFIVAKRLDASTCHLVLR